MRPINLFFVFLFFCVTALCSCNSGATKLKAPSIDTTLATSPEPKPIPKTEFDRYYADVNNFYQNKLLRTGFNGGILVAKKGEVIFEAYHGYFNLRKKDSLINKHSAFQLASVSKTFTAMATLKLAQMGKLSINDDVKKYFPAFPYDNVTIRLLMSHRSGLPNYIYFMQKLGWNIKQHCTNQDVLNYLIKFKPPGTGKPDTHFSYCNTNFSLLALIIEKASGESYADFLQQQFFSPLHMNDTYVFNIKDSANAMPSYDWRGRPEAFTFLDCDIGDKNIYSTPEDLLKWDQALYSNKLFSKKTLEEAFTPYSNERPGIRNYGYGWRMNVYPNGKKVIYHNGWWHGNNSVFIRMIQDSVTIILLGNKYNRNIYEAKDMEGYFDPGLLLNASEKAEISNEEISANENPVNRISKKRKLPSKKVYVKRHKKSKKRR